MTLFRDEDKTNYFYELKDHLKKISHMNFNDSNKINDLLESIQYDVFPIYKLKSDLSVKDKYYLLGDLFPLMLVIIFDIIKNNKSDMKTIDPKFKYVIILWKLLIPDKTSWIILDDCKLMSLEFFINTYKDVKENNNDNEGYIYIKAILNAINLIFDLNFFLE